MDEKYMNLAIELAKRGIGKVNPNPIVGCVVVKEGRIIAQGYHKKYGGYHAERNALLHCSESPAGATLYVTLEPCCHYGKTPPCTDIIIESDIQKVVVGCLDPNPKVSGKGVKILRDAGIEVITGVMQEECLQMNKIFFHYIRTGRPFVTMKYAMTLDGKIATSTGKSKWITGPEARKKVHEDRNLHAAIMVGIGTVLADDPMLTCRLEGGRNPIRIVCDTNLRIPLTCNIVKTAHEVRTIIATSSQDEEKKQQLIELGVEVLSVPQLSQRIDLSYLSKAIGDMRIDSIYLEGGPTMNDSALKSKIVNQVDTYIAPKIFGGLTAPTPVTGNGIDEVCEGITLIHKKVISLGEDILIESEVQNSCSLEL